MKNVEMKVNGAVLEVKVDLTKDFGVSASGKSNIIASTEGNVSVAGRDEIKIGLNIYRPTKALNTGIEGSLLGVLGSNIVAELSKDKKTLLMKIDMDKRFGTSGSGKSEVVASTGGNIGIGLGEVKCGLNVYTPVKKN